MYYVGLYEENKNKTDQKRKKKRNCKDLNGKEQVGEQFSFQMKDKKCASLLIL